MESLQNYMYVAERKNWPIAHSVQHIKFKNNLASSCEYPFPANNLRIPHCQEILLTSFCDSHLVVVLASKPFQCFIFSTQHTSFTVGRFSHTHDEQKKNKPFQIYAVYKKPVCINGRFSSSWIFG